MSCVECARHRAVQRQSSDKRDSQADDYSTINPEVVGHEPQYDVVQLNPRHTQPHNARQQPHDTPAADDYAMLNLETLGQQPQYDVIRRR